MKNTIENILLQGSKQQLNDGVIWYTRLNRFCRDLGEKYNQPTWKVAAIMSILSPRTSFQNNIYDTENMLKNGSEAYLKSPLFRRKATKALNCESFEEVRNLFVEKTGRKTLSFFENMLLIGKRATIDVHMIRFFGISGSLTDKKYREAEKHIQDYAKKIQVEPYQLQAMIWCTVRGQSF